jgi:hypothetical protein
LVSAPYDLRSEAHAAVAACSVRDGEARVGLRPAAASAALGCRRGRGLVGDSAGSEDSGTRDAGSAAVEMRTRLFRRKKKSLPQAIHLAEIQIM